MFRLGYNTNGFNCHSLESALEIIANLGYRGVAITLDNYILNPAAAGLDSQLERTRAMLKEKNLACVIETGARFLLNPRIKHEPTLISADSAGRRIRIDFLKRALDIAVQLEAEALSFWSGVKPADVREAEAWNWLIEGCRELSDYAGQHDVPLAFEPEPGMFIENLTQHQKLSDQIRSPLFCLTLDIGHAYLTEDSSVAKCIRNYRDEIKNVHLEDMKKGEHKHLQFGEGEIDFAEVFNALKEIEYTGLINVELSLHSRNAVHAAEHAYNFLSNFIKLS